MKPIIYQSAHILALSSMETFEAVLDNGRQGFKNLSTGTVVTDDLPSLAQLVFVLPVEPLLGDQVITYYEGQMAMGMIAGLNIGGEGTFMLDLDGVDDYVVAPRNLFHVIEARKVPEDAIMVTIGDEAVVVESTNGNFPLGTRATIVNILPHPTSTDELASIVIAVNALGQIWDASGAIFRPYDATIIDFNFTDEAKIVPKSNAAVIEEINIHDIGDIDPAVLEGLGDEVPELSDDNVGMYVTDQDGKPVAWEDIPEEVRDALRSISDQIKASAKFNEAVPEEPSLAFAEETGADQSADDPLDAAVDSFFTALLGAAYIAQAIEDEEERIDAQITAFATESEMLQVEHEEFITDGLTEMEQRITRAVTSVSMISNIVGRMVSRATTDAESRRLEHVATMLSSLRDEVIEIGKCNIDVAIDVKVNRAVQDDITDKACALL